MAQIIQNEKGFKVIRMSTIELVEKLGQYGSLGICDLCNQAVFEGYYVAVLNRFLCPDCYKEWYERATRYHEDNKIEEHNFNYYKKLFKL